MPITDLLDQNCLLSRDWISVLNRSFLETQATIQNRLSKSMETNNIRSVKVVEKNEFCKSDEKLPGNMLLYRFDFNTDKQKYLYESSYMD